MIPKSKKAELLKQSQKINDLITKGAERFLEEHTLEALGNELGQSTSWVSQSLNPLSPTRFAAEHLPILDCLFGGSLSKAIAESMGNVCVPKAKIEAVAVDMNCAADLVKEVGEALAAIGTAMNCKMTTDLATWIGQELDDVVCLALAIKLGAKAAAERRTA